MKNLKLNLFWPIGFDDLFEAIDIILETNTNNEKTIVFFKKLFELSDKIENRYYILEKAHALDEKFVITSLSRKLQKPSMKFSYPLINNYIPAKYKNSPVNNRFDSCYITSRE